MHQSSRCIKYSRYFALYNIIPYYHIPISYCTLKLHKYLFELLMTPLRNEPKLTEGLSVCLVTLISQIVATPKSMPKGASCSSVTSPF